MSVFDKFKKKLYYATHLNGAHIDFYHFPFGQNKDSHQTNILKFGERIAKSRDNLKFCANYGIYLSSNSIEIIISQINHILSENKIYWTNFGFDDDQITIITRIYSDFKTFLEKYKKFYLDQFHLDQIQNTINSTFSNKFKYYLIKCNLNQNTGISTGKNILNVVQKMALKKSAKIVEKIKIMYQNDSLENILNDLKKSCETHDQKILSESELLELIMSSILKLENSFKNNSDKQIDIILPEPHKIKIKDIPNLIAPWSSKGYVSKRYIFVNRKNPKIYKKREIQNLCAAKVIPGEMTHMLNLRTNSKFKNNFYTFNSLQQQSMKYDSQENHIFYYLEELLNCVKIVLDIGKNYSNAVLKVDDNLAKHVLQKYTILTPHEINVEILNFNTFPGKSCKQINKILDLEF